MQQTLTLDKELSAHASARSPPWELLSRVRKPGLNPESTGCWSSHTPSFWKGIRQFDNRTGCPLYFQKPFFPNRLLKSFSTCFGPWASTVSVWGILHVLHQENYEEIYEDHADHKSAGEFPNERILHIVCEDEGDIAGDEYAVLVNLVQGRPSRPILDPRSFPSPEASSLGYRQNWCQANFWCQGPAFSVITFQKICVNHNLLRGTAVFQVFVFSLMVYGF